MRESKLSGTISSGASASSPPQALRQANSRLTQQNFLIYTSTWNKNSTYKAYQFRSHCDIIYPCVNVFFFKPELDAVLN